jgi:hypothetical protein
MDALIPMGKRIEVRVAVLIVMIGSNKRKLYASRK